MTPAIQLLVFDAGSGKLISQSELGHKKLEKQRWFELVKGERPALETVRSFLPDIESALPLKRIPAMLCNLRLLPIRVRAERFSLQSDCNLSYGMP